MLPHRLHWPLIFGLATLALVRPLFSIVGWSDALGKPATPVLLANALCGLAAGGISLLVRRARGKDVCRSDLGDLSQ